MPHIFAADRESMFYAPGLGADAGAGQPAASAVRRVARPRRRVLGPSHVELDRWVHLNGVPERAQAVVRRAGPDIPLRTWTRSRAASTTTRRRIPRRSAQENRVVLPVTGVDVVRPSDARRALRLHGVDRPPAARGERVQARGGNVDRRRRCSARMSIRSSRSDRTRGRSGRRTPRAATRCCSSTRISAWGNTFYRYMEMHLVGPELQPVRRAADRIPRAGRRIQRHAGWGRTVNTIDTVDFFKLTVKDGQYLYDGQLRTFERATQDAQNQAA